MKSLLRASLAVLLILHFALLSTPTSQAEQGDSRRTPSVTWTEVYTQINIYKNLLLASIEANGRVSYPMDFYSLGITALTGYALLEAGVPAGSAEMSRLVNYCLDQPHDRYSVYTVSCLALLFTKIDPDKYRTRLGILHNFLVVNQLENGMWGYAAKGGDVRGISEIGDNSNTQFAILALKALHDCGFQSPEKVWTRSRAHFVNSQNKDGGWGYASWIRSASYPAMTAAGVASLWIIREVMEGKHKHCEEVVKDVVFERAMTYLDNNFDPSSSTIASWKGYMLYAVERVGIFTSRRYIADMDWYRAGAAELVQRGVTADRAEIAFGLLFLAKGKDPLLVQKLELTGRDWDNDHYDLQNLTRFYIQKMGVPVAWQVAKVRGDARDLLEAPVLIISTRKDFDLMMVERNAILEYLQNGGTILALPASDSESFDRSFRKIMQEMFPDSPLIPLPKDCEIYTYIYDIPMADRPTIYAQSQGCVFNLLYIPRGRYTCKWTTEDRSNHSFELGVNVLSFLSGDRQLKNRIDPVRFTKLSDPDEKRERPSRGAVVVGQLKHAGQWRPLRRDIVHLMEHLRDKAGVTVGIYPEVVDLEFDDPYLYPVLYMTGLHSFSATEASCKKLREFILRGGFLFADPACGRKEFDIAFREFMKKVFPEKELTAIPMSHQIHTIGYDVRSIKYRPSVLKLHPDLNTPKLEGVLIDDRYGVVYSSFNFSSGVDGMPAPICWGYSPEDSVKIAVNIMLYALNN